MDHIADLDRAGTAFLDAARAAGLRAPVADCPGWDVARLVDHTGKVLERTTIVVSERLDTFPDKERLVRYPDDESAFDRFGSALEQVVTTLGGVDPTTPLWNFTGDQLTASFWQRRMANEVAVHCVDAERAAAAERPVAADRAVDGIDELLTVMLPFRATFAESDLSGSIHVHCTDTEGEWLTVFADGRPATTREHAKGDLAVRGPASALFLWSWNRAEPGDAGIETFGDPALLEAWKAFVP